MQDNCLDTPSCSIPWESMMLCRSAPKKDAERFTPLLGRLQGEQKA